MIILSSRYYSTQHLSAKSDVFSFGVVLLEIVSGREPLNIHRPRNEWSLVEWVRPCYLQLKGNMFIKLLFQMPYLSLTSYSLTLLLHEDWNYWLHWAWAFSSPPSLVSTYHFLFLFRCQRTELKKKDLPAGKTLYKGVKDRRNCGP